MIDKSIIDIPQILHKGMPPCVQLVWPHLSHSIWQRYLGAKF